MERAIVVGAGLAGCEAAWQLASRGVPVTLVEMKPHAFTPAHHSAGFAELVCSNSLRSDQLTNAVGLLKEEMRQLGSLILKAADATRVPAGGALAVDREKFSDYVTQAVRSHPLIEVEERELCELPQTNAVIATGPLTSDRLAEKIAALPGLETLNFYDAAAPIVSGESLDMAKVFRQGRYGRGDDYLNCPMNREEYEAFYHALLTAEKAEVHGFDGTQVFEGCMPIEVMAARGEMVMAFGPMKPVGLVDPRTGREPYAAVQLRAENEAGTMYNLVGFQTNLKWGEQKRVFSMIPGLQDAEFVRYGVMHRNTFLNSPKLLGPDFRLLGDKTANPLWFAGQMTGVEGYMESAMSGLVAGHALAREMLGLAPFALPEETMCGALCRHVSTSNADFQPMGANMGLLPPLPERVRDKKLRYLQTAERAIAALKAELSEKGFTGFFAASEAHLRQQAEEQA